MKKRRCYAIINLDNLIYNYNLLLDATGNTIMAVVKANAYGHGAIKVSEALERRGCKRFAVSTVGEAVQLRQSGIVGDILLLGYCPIDYATTLAEYRICATLHDIDYANELNAYAIRKGFTLDCQLKIDTGMGRIGFDYRKIGAYVNLITKLTRLNVIGAYTHLSCADLVKKGDLAYTNLQRKRFSNVIGQLTPLNISLFHCDNTYGALDGNAQYSCSRMGLGLYGMLPNAPTKQVMSLYAIVSQIKTVDKGSFVGYGRVFAPGTKTKVATVCIGYADGLPRAVLPYGYMLVSGKPAKIVAVTMDQTMLDVTGIDCAVGDYATVIDVNLTPTTIAQWCNTINYEITCGIANRIERIYLYERKNYGKLQSTNFQ